MDTFRRVRQLGAAVDNDGLVTIADQVIQTGRTGPDKGTRLGRSWSSSFKRRHQIKNMKISSTRASSTPMQVEADNRWRREYEEVWPARWVECRDNASWKIAGFGFVCCCVSCVVDWGC